MAKICNPTVGHSDRPADTLHYLWGATQANTAVTATCGQEKGLRTGFRRTLATNDERDEADGYDAACHIATPSEPGAALCRIGMSTRKHVPFPTSLLTEISP